MKHQFNSRLPSVLPPVFNLVRLKLAVFLITKNFITPVKKKKGLVPEKEVMTLVERRKGEGWVFGYRLRVEHIYIGYLTEKDWAQKTFPNELIKKVKNTG